MRAAADLERFEDENILLRGPQLLRHDRLQILVGELDLPVGELLEPRERAVHVIGIELEPDLRERVDERVAPAVLAQDDAVALEADLERVHDLVGGPVREHAVLVDPALVRERRGAHDRLVRLHAVAGERRHEP